MPDKKNYEILSGNTVVAVWQDGNLEVINKDLLPLFLKRISDADMWLETRAIDSHRANSRLLKKALRLAEKDDISTVAHVNAATITDNYWIRPVGSDLTFDDVRFTDDYFSNLALKGTYDSFNKAATSKKSRTPELTNVGSFEKCWKIRDGKWWMFKKATHSEMFSELFVYELGLVLGFNMAVYERGDGCIKSLDFTDGASVNFEPASTFMADNEDYPDVIKALKTLCPDAIPDYIRLIFMDTITANPDRHTNNFGLLRNVETGKLVGLAPNYDNNMALIARGYPSKPKSKDLLITLFNELTDEYPEYKEFIPELTEETIRNVLDKINMKVRSQTIIDFVMSRYNSIK
ncbi:MAG: hypothetical protein J6Q94_00145 [Clostridia bacterium]|nr:hypothetical protein [Clostridia bacterium]